MKKSTTIVYPRSAYIAYVLVQRSRELNFFLPFNEVFTDLNRIKLYTDNFLRQNSNENTFIPQAPIVFPIHLDSKFPLKPAYWEEPTEELSKTERINNFLRTLENHHFQKLLVTPVRNGSSATLKAAYCFNIKAKDAEIAFFLTNNFLSMDEKAKFAAIYLFGNPFRFELLSGKRIEIKDPQKSFIH